ncbi:MAG: proteinral secretion pathway protein A [Puniceicoccaceae bacterium 5H]|nr:MAG: proteinral secretion pathway protein A [Puniceicoccaceae bacterium 5H]
MYQHFYGLREMPFHITPDPRFLYLAPTHQEALAHLRYGISEKKGFMVLTGEVGCGKTTICRQLLNELADQDVETALILNPRLSEAEMLEAILTELGQTPVNGSKHHLLDQLNQHLLQVVLAGRNIVVIIDESQNLGFETLEQLRLLSNLETDSQKLLQIILIGQPELRAKLKEERLRQLRQRVLVHYDLRRLTREEVALYIQHRLTLAGGQGRPSFTQRAVKRIHRVSQGIPRIINNLCDKALLAAFVKNQDVVGYHEVGRAIKECELK